MRSSGRPRRFSCEQCGAVLAYEPGTTELVCAWCGHRNRIREPATELVEQDFAALPAGLAEERIAEAPEPATCEACGAGFEFAPGLHAGPCPFCGQAVVVDPGRSRRLVPQAVLPFLIGEPEARRLVESWLKGLWFAPSRLTTEARSESRLSGRYLPYWTFDSRTRARYAGRRGDVYYVPVQVTAVVDGRRTRQTRMEPRVRWTPVAGEIARDFDDVPVAAGSSVPEALQAPLEPWDLDGLKPYTPAFLPGFESELYQLPVGQGFAKARERMQEMLRDAVRHDIGGDQQIIERLEIDWRDPTFKLVLLPVWTKRLAYIGRSWRVLVNARTGEVHGERPWSVWKITAAILAALLAAGALALLLHATGSL
ncbi:hypothetical protein SH611_08990 [Geminicoccaceae bacterium 1502E]|nr:hypothetical protein [Geminicoccaceae bacterium 1502E]